MKNNMTTMRVLMLSLLIAPAAARADAMQQTEPAQVRDSSDLSGVWKAKKRFGPDSRGPLVIRRNGTAYTADMMGLTVPVAVTDGEWSFELPNGGGGFRGRRQPNGTVRGLWFAQSINAATPVTLLASAPDRWSGAVMPLDEEQTFYLSLKKQPDGMFAAVLRNIERDWGSGMGVRGLVQNGSVIALMGRRGVQTRDTVITTGSFDRDAQVLTLSFPGRGGSYDFERADEQEPGFYPRAKNPARYVYHAPVALDDGWSTASVDEVGINRSAVEQFMQHIIDMSMDSINAPQIHSLLIVRRGKLVLEEYFHGERRDKLHNTRSASKSVSATIIGAAMRAGVPLTLSTPVYKVMNGGAFPADLEPRKRAMTLEHLMTMSSGYYCDDNDDKAPGNEGNMWNRQSEQPDFYKLALGLPMAYAPGEKAIYCSINPNLALGMAGVAARESPFYMFMRLVADPMDIHRYVWPLDGVRHPYGGGGLGLTARDFIKFGQLMLNGGTWRGRRILDASFVARATSPLMKIGERDYGLLWWPEGKPYKGRTVNGYAMLGAGGNLVYVYPELELVIATTGGSYLSRGWRYAGGELIPNFILPSVQRLGENQ